MTTKTICNYLKIFKKSVQLVNPFFLRLPPSSFHGEFGPNFFLANNNNNMWSNDDPALRLVSWKEAVEHQSTDDEKEDDPYEDPGRKERKARVPKCKYCRFRPCIMADGGLYACLLEFFQDFCESDYEAKNLTEKQVRFKLYRHATFMIHGYLGKGVRIELPKCVRGEIMDLIPAPDGKYVGFKEASKDDEDKKL